MKMMKICVTLLISLIVVTTHSYSQEANESELDSQEVSETELAKQAQNPVSSLISLPFQNNINFDTGPRDKIQNVLNIQPVYPTSLNDKWNLITRTIVPVISQPGFSGRRERSDGIETGRDRTDGLGDTTFTGFLSPKNSGGLIWGAGPVFLFPTATDDILGADKWGIGPSAVALKMSGKWVYGSLISHMWSFAGSGDTNINLSTCQYFINYNIANGWYLTSSPLVTANWEAESDSIWTVPVGGGFGKIFKIGKQPFNAQVQAFANVAKPDFGAEWTLRVQLQLLFPKKKN
jgi:hypothetical protein